MQIFPMCKQITSDFIRILNLLFGMHVCICAPNRINTYVLTHIEHYITTLTNSTTS